MPKDGIGLALEREGQGEILGPLSPTFPVQPCFPILCNPAFLSCATLLSYPETVFTTPSYL
jgi:hypothetical protein